MKSPHALHLHRKHFNNNRTIYVVDVDQSRWFNLPVRDLGDYGRRKFENWIVLQRPKERIKVTYA